MKWRNSLLAFSYWYSSLDGPTLRRAHHPPPHSATPRRCSAPGLTLAEVSTNISVDSKVVLASKEGAMILVTTTGEVGSETARLLANAVFPSASWPTTRRRRPR
jgi:hypothetical protein